jgi:hypothetical protein
VQQSCLAKHPTRRRRRHGSTIRSWASQRSRWREGKRRHPLHPPHLPRHQYQLLHRRLLRHPLHHHHSIRLLRLRLRQHCRFPLHLQMTRSHLQHRSHLQQPRDHSHHFDHSHQAALPPIEGPAVAGVRQGSPPRHHCAPQRADPRRHMLTRVQGRPLRRRTRAQRTRAQRTRAQRARAQRARAQRTRAQRTRAQRARAQRARAQRTRAQRASWMRIRMDLVMRVVITTRRDLI